MKRRNLTSPGIAMLSLALAGAAAVHAETYSTPGLNCVEHGDSAPEIFYSGNNGEAGNENESHHATYECPLFRRTPDTSSISSINVLVDDSSSDASVNCFALSCTSSGSCGVGASDASSGTGKETLALGSVTGFTNGYAYIECDVPDADSGIRSGVVSYRWTD